MLNASLIVKMFVLGKILAWGQASRVFLYDSKVNDLAVITRDTVFRQVSTITQVT